MKLLLILLPIITQYSADYGSLNRYYFVDGSPERAQRFIKLDDDYLQKLEKINYSSLSTGDRVDYILFKRNLKENRRAMEQELSDYNSVKKWFPFADSIYALESRRRRGLTPDAAAVAASLQKISAQIISSRELLAKDAGVSFDLATAGSNVVGGFREALKSTFDFYNGYHPDFSWRIPTLYNTVDSLLGTYAFALRNKARSSSPVKDETGIVGKPIGAEEMTRQLQAQFIPYSPEELLKIAEKEFAWCDAEMLKASAALGFGNKWKDALEKVKNSYVPPGEQPAAILRLYNESIDFIKKHDMVTIPPIAEETWRMGMMTPQRQLVSPFFLGGEQILISYPTNTMAEPDKLMSMRGNNPHFSRATVHHELIAGHHLQMFMNDRYKTYRNFDNPFWMEGWALYWEFILWDAGFAQKAEDKIGMLFWRMHRCARIIFSINYHLNKWTPRQCIDFLVDRVGHEPANAEGEVRRSFTGGYGPLYQLAYMLGGLQFYELKKELVDSKKMTLRQFHDAVLQENAMPVEMVRAILTNQQLPKDFQSWWKFYRF